MVWGASCRRFRRSTGQNEKALRSAKWTERVLVRTELALGSHGQDLGPVLLVVVEDEVSKRVVVRKRLAKLLRDPGRGRMLGYADVEHGAACVVDYEEDVEDAERRGRNGEEVHRGEDLTVIT